MPAPFDYNIQRPDIMGAIGAYEAGRDRNRQVTQQNKQDMFAQYLPGALKGDQQALQGAQQNATPEQQMQLQNALAQMEDRQLQQTLQQQEKFARLAQWADTPEKWAQATRMAEAEGLKGATQVPFEQRGAKLAGMLSVKDQLDQEWKRREFELRQRDTNSAIAARNAASSRAGAPNIDPNSGRRLAPAGIQGRDYSAVDKFSTSADAAANIATTLRGIEGNLNKNMTGPGFGAKRNVAGILSYLPNFGIEKALTGSDVTREYVDNYDAIEQASKTIGIDTLQKVGGSDTERELLTAIQTTVNPDVSPSENKRRFRQQLAAADILAKKAQLASEWVNTYGSLQYAAPDGTTWQKFWPAYQRQEWNAFTKSEKAQGSGPRTQQPSSILNEADAIVSGGIGPATTKGSF